MSSSRGEVKEENRDQSVNNAYTDFTLKCCSEEEVDGIRHHILKFQTKNKIDPLTQFERPIRLHRKDPRNLQFQLTRKEIDERKKEREEREAKLKERMLQKQRQKQEQDDNVSINVDNDSSVAGNSEAIDGSGNNIDDSEEDEIDQEIKRRAAQEKEEANKNKKNNKPETDMSIVAPDGGARKPKKNLFKKKTRQINIMDEQKRKLRYEEYYPWVIEDYNGKNTWVGSYEAGNSDSYVLFVFDKDGFKMVPAEKVYKFTPRNNYATLTLEEAESRMQKNAQVPRWLMKHMADDSKQSGSKDPRFRKRGGNFKTVVGSTDDSNGRNHDGDDYGNFNDDDNGHNEDIDYDDEFDDDEEAPIIEDEQQNRDSEQRMRREMLSANALGNDKDYRDEDEDDDDEFADLFGSRKTVDKDVKKLRKALVKTEMNEAYDTDDSENPYLSESEEEEEDEDEEVAKDENEASKIKKENEDNVIAPKNRSQSPQPRKIVVKSNKNLMITIKVPKETLASFPKSEWDNNYSSRPSFVGLRSVDVSEKDKKVKEEQTEMDTIPIIKKEDEVDMKSALSPKNSNRSRSHTPSDDDLLTEEDIKQIIQAGPISVKELLAILKPKIHRHPQNKVRIKELFKKCLRNHDGLLYLKN
ncbi:hypothetical protein PACTADRAFT_49254 [Pachysolen tannophilus NRRL Y-2460]|uniref:Transcription initiation factor IIF subunit alpha n=1 Tax=Pachysolen tannophilus NRRL Y-2460 TaxID=669874 RepID=A0A1E4TVP9_PACTA|nr:hypothetical protein PACTADRAFT_49254 [Pachysolen tannophilus NRRL Y-2460]